MPGQEARADLAWSLRERTERDVYVASAWHPDSESGFEENLSFGKSRTVKRPEGRAPAQILVGELNAYRTAGGFSFPWNQRRSAEGISYEPNQSRPAWRRVHRRHPHRIVSPLCP